MQSARRYRNARAQESSQGHPEKTNAAMLAFWNGKGGVAWVGRQDHTDTTADL
ncbi:MAG: hypothetical protein IH582_17690 [Afipia sp.]|nr:hypothetical protein [Afipia sp.]